MNRQDWQRAFGEPDEAFQRYLRQTLDNLEDRRVKTRYRFPTVLAAVLLVMLLAGAGFAAGQLGIFDLITGVGIQPLADAERLVERNLGMSENDRATLSVEEAVFDGQGILVKCRLRLKDGDGYALFDEMMLDASDGEYLIEEKPAKVPEGVQSWTDGESEQTIINQDGQTALLVNGEETPLPSSAKEAQKMGVEVYLQDGELYYNYWERTVLGRKDGKKLANFWIEIDSMEEKIFMDTASAELDEDGSVIWWASGTADAPLNVDSVEMTADAWLRYEDEGEEEKSRLPAVDFTLLKSEAERRYALVPEETPLDGAFELQSASIICTKIRGYLSLRCKTPADADVDFYFYDASGSEIEMGSGGGWSDDGVLYYNREMQSLEEIPDTIYIDLVYGDDTVPKGRIKCSVIAE